MDGGRTWLGPHTRDGWEISVGVGSRARKRGVDGGGFKQNKPSNTIGGGQNL